MKDAKDGQGTPHEFNDGINEAAEELNGVSGFGYHALEKAVKQRNKACSKAKKRAERALKNIKKESAKYNSKYNTPQSIKNHYRAQKYEERIQRNMEKMGEWYKCDDDAPQSEKARCIMNMAPYLDQESLREVVQEFIAGNLDINIVSILHYLEEDELKLLAEKVCAADGGKYKGLTFSNLLHYLEDETVSEMFLKYLDVGTFDKKYLPYLNDETLHEVAKRFCDGRIKDIDITSAYYYFDEDDINLIVKHFIESGEKVDKHIYPYLNGETLHAIVLEYAKNENSCIDIDSLYPYLDEEDLNILFRAYMKKK